MVTLADAQGSVKETCGLEQGSPELWPVVQQIQHPAETLPHVNDTYLSMERHPIHAPDLCVLLQKALDLDFLAFLAGWHKGGGDLQCKWEQWHS